MTGMLSVDTLCELFDRYAPLGLPFVLPMDGKMYVSRRTDLLENEARLLRYPLVEVPDLKQVIYKPMNKIVLNGPLDDIARAMPILSADQDPRYQWHRSHDNYIDCYARGIDKGAPCARAWGWTQRARWPLATMRTTSSFWTPPALPPARVTVRTPPRRTPTISAARQLRARSPICANTICSLRRPTPPALDSVCLRRYNKIADAWRRLCLF